MEWLTPLVTSTIGILGFGFGTWQFLNRKSHEKELETLKLTNQLSIEQVKLIAEYDKGLRKDRADAYSELLGLIWPLINREIKIVAEFMVDSKAQKNNIYEILERTNEWYNKKGVLYIPTESLSQLNKFKEIITRVSNDLANAKNSNALDQITPIVADILVAYYDLSEKFAADLGTTRDIVDPTQPDKFITQLIQNLKTKNKN